MNGTNPTDVSVIVCCYNSAKRLPETLKHLARQSVPPSIPWEVVVVNNASTDDTGVVAARLWAEHGSPAPLRVVNEPTPGLSHAREKGIATARYDILIFVDDDNWLDPNYVRVASEIMQQQPQVGVIGGDLIAEFESSPPEWFAEKQSYFAVGKQGRKSGDVTGQRSFFAGAGLVLRKSAYLKLKQRAFEFVALDRCQNELSASGDVELCYAIALLGYRLWYDERLRLKHFMLKQRLTREYLGRLVRGVAASGAVMTCYETALRDPGRGAWFAYSCSVRKHAHWATKTAVKFFIGRVNWTVCRLEWLGFWRSIVSLPELLRIFRRHYPAILRLKEAPPP